MSSYPIEPHNGLFPVGASRKLTKQLDRLDAQALAVQHHDSLQIGRVEQATAHGLIAVAQISALEASLVRMTPHAAGRLQAVAGAGTIGIAGIIARAGR
jgi:hypothetical protein